MITILTVNAGASYIDVSVGGLFDVVNVVFVHV